MRFLYLTFLNEDLRDGYRNKIHSQCKGLACCGYHGNLLIVSNNGFKIYEYDKSGKETLNKVIGFTHKRKSERRNLYDELIIFFQFLSVAEEIINVNFLDFIYIRQVVPITPMLLCFLKKIRKKNIKILYEYPTYPWKVDLKYVTNSFFYYLDCLLYRFLEKRVDKIVCFGQYNGTNNKYIESMNGINVGDYPININKTNKANEIHFIAVANVLEVHGYDRFIQGMGKYYKERYQIKVYFHIVGNIPSRLKLKSMVHELNIDNYVIFHGYKNGQELDDLYATMDCAVDTLAYYRRGDDCIAGSLKSREYLARGLPFVFSGNLDIAMKKSYDFMIRVPINPEIINIKNVVNEFYKITTSSENIRKFAANHLNWHIIMKNILIDAQIIK